MPALFFVLLLAVGSAFGGCRDASPPPPSGADAPVTAPTATALAATAPDSLSAGATADLVRRYYAALDARDYRRAYALWGEDGPPDRQTYDAFVDGFAETASVAAEVGAPSDPEGAAGSIYATVPVTVRARTTAGEAQTFTGTYTLRRVNDVPGATPAQLRWHLESADLRRSP